jgi:hypothetical protein
VVKDFFNQFSTDPLSPEAQREREKVAAQNAADMS